MTGRCADTGGCVYSLSVTELDFLTAFVWLEPFESFFKPAVRFPISLCFMFCFGNAILLV